MKKSLLFILALLIAIAANGKDYYARDFGVSGDGVTLNTRSIQAAIDLVSNNGGGRLIFTPGNYVTGSIYLRSNVMLQLDAGATILGSNNPFDYVMDSTVRWKSLIFAIKQDNIGITGKGIIDGRGFTTAINTLDMVHRGVIADDLMSDRVREPKRPENIYFRECKNVIIRGITLKDPASWNETYDQCENLTVDNIRVDSKAYWNNDGIDIVDCKHVVVRNSDFDAADDVLCLKSHDATKMCNDVLIENCIVRSSANAIKFGTVSRGGFENITIKNITIFNTYRSAIALEAVDGGFIQNILIDSVRAVNTGNAIFLRVGNRWSSDGKKSFMKDVTIENLSVEVPSGKPDRGYNYEGPIEDLPRNVSPSSIVGLPDHTLENVLLKNIEITCPGGGDPFYAYRGLTPAALDSIPEMPAAYPEFSQFKELPAWGFFIRHAKGIKFENVVLRADKKDYRPSVVIDDANDVEFSDTHIDESGTGGKKEIFSYKSDNIKIK